ncbi:hypothetical protein [Microbacterium sp. Leaf320]|uniref:hypothetical protein n=1 Tax=Microbacterium sp. Leaf320 TaxID=1736334 RepID=UPI0006FB59BF|nr:hypothetical protein [Microbacterium sp. Leaf320]KQQ66104.1 hypothetical protein ASF63_12340 [Microbacterium sp. Leaf320]
MTSDTFYAKSDRYTQNVAEGSRTMATPALLNTPYGTAEPGVAVYVDQNVRFVIPLGDALRIANQIADIASAHRDSAYDH